MVAPHPRSLPTRAEDLLHDASLIAVSGRAQRGYVDGFDIDDRLSAEAEIDAIALDRASAIAAPAERPESTVEPPRAGQ